MTARCRVLLTAGAEADLADLHRWVANREGEAAAEALLDRLLARIEGLETFPDRGSVPPELDALGIREFRQLSAPPYRLLYRRFGDAVFVLLIADGRRDFRALLERRVLGG